jgi:hypothetical protein
MSPQPPGITIAIPKVEFDMDQMRQMIVEVAAATQQPPQPPAQPPVINVQVPQQKAPIVNVQPPVVHVASPKVNVQPSSAKVNVEAQPAAKFDVPTTSKIKVIRNEDGEITGATVERK